MLCQCLLFVRLSPAAYERQQWTYKYIKDINFIIAIFIASPAVSLSLFTYFFVYLTKTSTNLKVVSELNFPIAAGLASSAAGFAALAFALGQLFHLDERTVIRLARIGFSIN